VLYLALELDAVTSFFVEEHDGDRGGRAVFSLRGNALVGTRF
jgi:hypothetical protein